MLIPKLCRVTGNPSIIGQYILVTGLGLKAFDDAIQALGNIHGLFAADAVCGNLQQFSTVEKHGFDCIKITNRFLTPRLNAPGEEEDRESLAIIDPRGYLKKAAKDRYIPHNENVVQYYRLKAKDAEEEPL